MADISNVVVDGVTYTLNDADAETKIAEKVSKSGDTMTGRLYIKSSNITDGTVPESHLYGQAIEFVDSTSSNKRLAYLQPVSYQSGNQGILIGGTKAGTSNTLGLLRDSSGNSVVMLNQSAWLSALGLTAAAYDSGWKDLAFSSAFENYGTGGHMRYRRVGNTVELRGVCKPTAAIAAGGSATIGTLPAGYRPSDTVYQVCHGSDKNTWLCSINSSGVITFARYGSNASAEAGAGIWGTCHVTFLTDNGIPS